MRGLDKACRLTRAQHRRVRVVGHGVRACIEDVWTVLEQRRARPGRPNIPRRQPIPDQRDGSEPRRPLAQCILQQDLGQGFGSLDGQSLVIAHGQLQRHLFATDRSTSTKFPPRVPASSSTCDVTRRRRHATRYSLPFPVAEPDPLEASESAVAGLLASRARRAVSVAAAAFATGVVPAPRPA